MENIGKNNSLESAKNRLNISGLTYLENTKYVNDRLVAENIDEVFKKYLPIVKNVDGDDVLRYKNLMNQYYWLINKFIPTCSYEQLCIRGGEKKWVEFTDICELRGEVLFRYLDFDYKVLNVITLLKGNTVDNNVSASLPGYTFLGWFTEREGGELFDFNTPITEDTDVFAQYEINTYQITFVYDDDDVETITVNYNELPHPSHVPSKYGYTFTGWDKTIVPATSDATYTAKYKINKYTVEFYDITNPDISLDEYFLIYTEEVKYEQGVVNIPANPTYPHYNFIRWSDGVDTGHSIDLTCITANTMAYAEVEPKTYTVIFYDWDNTIIPVDGETAQTIEYSCSAVAPDPGDIPARPNYVFLGWDKDFSNVSSNMYIHALYEGEPNKVEFLLPYDDEFDIVYYSAYTAYNTAIGEPAKPSMEDYDPYEYGIFDGWYADPNYETKYDFSSLITSDITIYGKWKTEFEVSFYNWDGTLITGDTSTFENPVYVCYGCDVPSAITEEIEGQILPKENYDFLGWDKSTTGITHDTKITALFSDTQIYTVRFVNGVDGSVIETVRVEAGSAILPSDYPEAPEMEKYNFSYWDGETLEVYDNMDVIAVYEPALMNVHFINIIGEPILDTTARYLSTGETPVVQLETLTVQGIEPDKPYIYYTMNPTGEFCLVTDPDDLYVEPDEDCINPESMVITEYDTTFVAKYDVIETGITSYNVKFFSQDRVYFFENRELYGTVIDSNYTNNILQIFDENGHGVTGDTQIFECWVDQDGNEYRNGINDYVVTSDISLTARYEFKKSPVKFYNASDNTEVTELAMMAIVNNPIARPNYLLIPEKPFYNRLINSDANNIWYKDIACTQEWEFKPESGADLIMPDTEYSLYANVYEGALYNLVFVTNGGSVVPVEQVQYPNSTVRPTDPTKQGFAFAGWYTDEEFEHEFVFGNSLTEDTILYAKWEESPVVCRIIYNATTDLRHIPALETMGDGVNIIREQCTYDSETGSGSLAYDNEITEIPSHTFESFETLRSVNIPEGVTSIGEYAFFNCTNLLNVDLSNNLTTISFSAFELCVGLTNISIPNSVTLIRLGAFRGCTSLRTFEFPENIEFIGDIVLLNCTGLTYIKCNAIVPPELQSASPPMPGPHPTPGPTQAFDGTNNCPIYVPCESVDDYKTAQEWSKYSDRIQCEQQTGSILHLNDSSTVVIPDDVLTRELISDVYSGTVVACEIGDNVTSIGNDAFLNCHFLTSIEIPNNVTSIGRYAFSNCTNLQTVILPDNLDTIPVGAFSLCESLTSIEIPDSVTSIGEGAFVSCRSLDEVIIGESVNQIGLLCFSDSNAISRVTCKASNPPTLIGNTFSSTIDVLYVKNDCVEDYENSDWVSYFTHIEGY